MGFLQKLFDKLRGPGPGRTPQDLARWLELPEAELLEWKDGPPVPPRGLQFSYREFDIPKRRGGTRRIEAPSDALKLLQRHILKRLLNGLPVHPAATGFVRSRSIVDNARPHISREVVINLDLQDFFPSITAARVEESLRGIGWNRHAARILAHICMHRGRLPQGAPTSPALSNLVCRRLDARLAALVKDNWSAQHAAEGAAGAAEGHYTRYADDITLSFPRFGYVKVKRPHGKGPPAQHAVARGLLWAVRRILQEEGFQIQKKKKIRIQRPHQRQTATGLVVNRRINLPRPVRRRIRAMQHRQHLGLLPPAHQQQLRGWEAVQHMVTRP